MGNLFLMRKLIVRSPTSGRKGPELNRLFRKQNDRFSCVINAHFHRKAERQIGYNKYVSSASWGFPFIVLLAVV